MLSLPSCWQASPLPKLPRANAKASSKTQLKQDTSASRDRQSIVHNIGLFEKRRDMLLEGGEQAPQACLDGIARRTRAFAEHDKQHVVDTSAKTIAGLTVDCAAIDGQVKDVEDRILQGVISLQHEINTRELLLEKLVEEKNTLLDKRKLARARCAECATRKQKAQPNEIVAVAAELKRRNLGLDEDMLARIAESDNVDGEGFTTVAREKAAKPTPGHSPVEAPTKNGFAALYYELDIFAATD